MAKQRKWVVLTKNDKGVWVGKCTYPGCSWRTSHLYWHQAATKSYMHKHD